MSLEHSPIENEIHEMPVTETLTLEEEGIDGTPTFADLESFEGALNAHYAGVDEVDAEVESLTEELEASDLLPEHIVEKTEGLTKRSTAGKVATFFALLAGAGVMAHTQTAEAANARDVRQVNTSIQKHNTNQMQVVRLQGQLAEIDLKQEQLVKQIAQLGGHAEQNQGTGTHGLTESDIKRMDTAFQAEVANLDVERLTALEALHAQTLSQPIREAKEKQIQTAHDAKVAALADSFNDQKAQESGTVLNPREQQQEIRNTQRDERKIASLQLQLQRLNTREQQIKMQMNGKQVQGALNDIGALITIFK